MAGNREINEIKGTPQTYVDTRHPHTLYWNFPRYSFRESCLISSSSLMSISSSLSTRKSSSSCRRRVKEWVRWRTTLLPASCRLSFYPLASFSWKISRSSPSREWGRTGGGRRWGGWPATCSGPSSPLWRTGGRHSLTGNISFETF